MAKNRIKQRLNKKIFGGGYGEPTQPFSNGSGQGINDPTPFRAFLKKHDHGFPNSSHFTSSSVLHIKISP